MLLAKHYPEFLTVTCLNWKPILAANEHKDVVINSLCFLVKENRIRVSCFVIMQNHFHLIWQVMGDHQREDVQRDFLRYTAQQILKNLRNNNSSLMYELLVNAKDRKYQVWERNSLSIELRSTSVFKQKVAYIHANPVRAGLSEVPETYSYSSAGFYELNDHRWDFLNHYED